MIDAAPFRVSRDSELELDDEGGRDFLEAVEEELRNRRRSEVVRVEIGAGAGDALRDVLTRRLEIEARQVYSIRGPLDVRVLGALADLPALDDLRDPPLKPQPVPELPDPERLFDVLEEAFDKAHDVGAVELGSEGINSMRFRLLMQDRWEPDLQAALQ